MRYFNDKTAKRMGKAEFSTNIVSEDLYNRWKASNPEFKLTYIEFSKLWQLITDQIQEEIVTNPQGVKLAFQCGELIIQYLPRNLKAKDQVNSDEEGEAVPFLNVTTKGKLAKISWIRKRAVRFNPQIILFAFKHTRNIAIKANEVITNKPEIFRNSNIKIHDKSGDNS